MPERATAYEHNYNLNAYKDRSNPGFLRLPYASPINKTKHYMISTFFPGPPH
jgi:hypothetical protein